MSRKRTRRSTGAGGSRDSRSAPKRVAGIGTLFAQAIGLGVAVAALSLVVERPAHSLWRATIEDASETEARKRSVHYSGCDEVRRTGAALIYRGEPGCREGMNGDGDGIAGEPYRRRWATEPNSAR